QSCEVNMKYKVHRFDLKMNTDKDKLEVFLNSLKGEIVSIVPNVKPTFMPMGATAKVDFLLIIERTA
ncbi:MAG: hypothetical protein SVM79_10205, partial [Chloroflexota bacterium]|nr:hypothetical protein [Chloroflexota bacterium]